MSVPLEKQVMHNVLSAIKKGETGSPQAPNGEYLTALNSVGIIEIGWDNNLTPLGHFMLDALRNDIEKWGS